MATYTIGSDPGDDYDDPKDAADDIGSVDWTLADGDEAVEQDGAQYTTAPTEFDHSNPSGYKVTFRPASGNWHDGSKTGSGFRWHADATAEGSATQYHRIHIETPGVCLKGIHFNQRATGVRGCLSLRSSAADDCAVLGCVIVGYNGTSENGSALIIRDPTNVLLAGCFLYDAYTYFRSASDLLVAGNTAHGNHSETTWGYFLAGGTGSIFRANYGWNEGSGAAFNETELEAQTWDLDDNVAYDTSAPGADGVDSDTTYVTSNTDLTLKTGHTVRDGWSTTTVSSHQFWENIDVLGQTRSDQDVGGHEEVASGATISIGILNAVANTLTPTFAAGGATASLGVLNGVGNLLDPTMSPGAVTVAVGNLEGVANLLDVTPSPGGATLAMDVLDAVGNLLDPGFAAGATSFALGNLNAVAEMLSVVIAATGDQTLVLGNLEAVGNLLDPTMAPGAVTVAAGLLEAVAEILDPTVAPGDATIALEELQAVAELLEPTFVSGASSVAIGLLEAVAELLTPSFSVVVAETGIVLALHAGNPVVRFPAIRRPTVAFSAEDPTETLVVPED